MCQFKSRCINRKSLSWDLKNNIFPKVTKMGSIFAHRIDYNGVGVLRDQLHMPRPLPQNRLTFSILKSLFLHDFEALGSRLQSFHDSVDTQFQDKT